MIASLVIMWTCQCLVMAWIAFRTDDGQAWLFVHFGRRNRRTHRLARLLSVSNAFTLP